MISINNPDYLATLNGLIAWHGAIPLVEGGKIVSAIGYSGGTGPQDELTCKAGVATVK